MGSEAEVVRESRPGYEYPAMWLLQYATHWDHDFFENEKDAHERFEYEKKCDTPCRLIRIPSESPATKRGEEACGFCGTNDWFHYHPKCAGVVNLGDQRPKESPCSSGSQGGGKDSAKKPEPLSSSQPSPPSASPSSSNPPAWVLPQILAACKPGEELFYFREFGGVLRQPGNDMWLVHQDGTTVYDGKADADARVWRMANSGSYTIPTPPPDKPKLDDAEEVADTAILHYESHTGRNTYCRGVLVGWVAAAIRADRQKHAGTRVVVASPTPEQAKAMLSTSNSGPITTMPGYNSIPPDLADRVKLLARFVENAARTGSEMHQVAREVLAMME